LFQVASAPVVGFDRNSLWALSQVLAESAEPYILPYQLVI
jgi:hypothetical protein